MDKAPPALPDGERTAPYTDGEPIFARARHTTYWLRCARTFLPSAYESGDASRMLFAFFIVSALDLLGLLDAEPGSEAEPKAGEVLGSGMGSRQGKASVGGKSTIMEEERKGWIDWIYRCLHRGGGFRGFTGTIVVLEGEGGKGEERESEWDAATLPATFFALCSLLVLGDNLRRVDRAACLRWTAKLQRLDGSFGELLSKRPGMDEGEIEGGRDLRFCCCAAGIVYMLRDVRGHDHASTSFREEALVRYIQSCQSYEGGFSQGPYREAHSGLNYCAVGAFSFLRLLSLSRDEQQRLDGLEEAYGGVVDLDACTRWILYRQTAYIQDEKDEAEMAQDEKPRSEQTNQPRSTTQQNDYLEPPDIFSHAGFNGRTNKIADTCYAFWNSGALAILGKQHLIDQDRLRRYLLGKMQHPIGGFGKGVGEPPDVLHAYLGLATLSLLGKDGLKPVDPTLCISVDAAQRIERLDWKRKDAG